MKYLLIETRLHWLTFTSCGMSTKPWIIFFLKMRLPPKTSDDVDEDPTGNKSFWDRGVLNGASAKAEVLCNYHVGETVLSLQKATLIPGGSESLVYTTLSGTVGVMVPFTSREDHDFFQALEMHLRSENPPLCGRDHLAFRSFYFPVKVGFLNKYHHLLVVPRLCCFSVLPKNRSYTRGQHKMPAIEMCWLYLCKGAFA